MTMLQRLVDSPVGPLLLETDGRALTRLAFHDATAAKPADSAQQHPVLDEAVRQLQAYFTGELRDFDLPLAAQGSQFQQRVWAQLCRIPFGTTASYADVATALGLPMTACRAVGLANGSNPIAIVIPCHRVIGTDGTLVGYGGGLHRKRFLLDLEAPMVQEQLFEM